MAERLADRLVDLSAEQKVGEMVDSKAGRWADMMAGSLAAPKVARRVGQKAE